MFSGFACGTCLADLLNQLLISGSILTIFFLELVSNEGGSDKSKVWLVITMIFLKTGCKNKSFKYLISSGALLE